METPCSGRTDLHAVRQILAHGLRLMDHTKAEKAITSAAKAATAAGLRTNIATSDTL